MLKNFTLILCITVLCLSGIPTAFAADSTRNEASLAKEVEAAVVKLGTGTDNKLEIVLKDGTKVKGNISQINTDGFVIKNAKGETSTSVAYGAVKTLKAKRALPRIAKFGIILGVFIVAMVVLVSVGFKGGTDGG